MHAAMGLSPGKALSLLADPQPKLDESMISNIVVVLILGDLGFKGTQSLATLTPPRSCYSV
jgi:hypothetical protein